MLLSVGKNPGRICTKMSIKVYTLGLAMVFFFFFLRKLFSVSVFCMCVYF